MANKKLRKAALSMVVAKLGEDYKKVPVIAMECADCKVGTLLNATLAGDGAQPFCPHCGGELAVSDNYESEDTMPESDEEITGIQCSNCGTTHMSTNDAVAKLGGVLHCVACSEPLGFETASDDNEDDGGDLNTDEETDDLEEGSDDMSDSDEGEDGTDGDDDSGDMSDSETDSEESGDNSDDLEDMGEEEEGSKCSEKSGDESDDEDDMGEDDGMSDSEESGDESDDSGDMDDTEEEEEMGEYPMEDVAAFAKAEGYNLALCGETAYLMQGDFAIGKSDQNFTVSTAKALESTLINHGAKAAMAAFKFEPIIASLKQDAIKAELDEDAIEEEVTARLGKVGSSIEDYKQSMAIAVAAIDKSFYGKGNPVKSVLVASLAKMNIKESVAKAIIDEAFAKSGNDYCSLLVQTAESMMDKGPEVRNELSDLVAQAEQKVMGGEGMVEEEDEMEDEVESKVTASPILRFNNPAKVSTVASLTGVRKTPLFKY